MSPEQELATLLHGFYCKEPHEDHCGWFWEGGNWDGYAHKRWLEHAREMLPLLTKIVTATTPKDSPR